MEEEKVNAVSPLHAILVITATFFLIMFLGALFFLTLGTGPAIVLTELLVLIVPLSYMLLKHVNIKSYVGLDVKPEFVMVGFASGVLLFFLDVGVSFVLTSIFGVSQAVEESNAMITSLGASTSGLILVTLALSLAGVCEEFAFRGFLQNTINRRYSFIPAVIVSSVTFGLFHFDPQLVYILSALIAGLALGYIYHRWNSYVVSAIAHSTVNLIVLVILLLAI